MVLDSLYRISLKCVIKNDTDQILLIKETGRELWDFPGGGIEHGETVRDAIARELHEEAAFSGGFSYRVVGMADPKKLRTRDIWQMILILEVVPEYMPTQLGLQADAMALKSIDEIHDLADETEPVVQQYINMTS